MLATAVACRPALLLAAELSTPLDATLHIQVLLFLRSLQQELGLAMIFVTHDLGVALEVSRKLAVMYAGRMVESGSVHDIVRNPRHPYTEGLLHSTVHEVEKDQQLTPIRGSPPNLAALPPGCSFSPRCRYAATGCNVIYPPRVTLETEGAHAHLTCCHYPDRIGSATAMSS
jgi:peptide/nickel transport system ATP-binding protein